MSIIPADNLEQLASITKNLIEDKATVEVGWGGRVILYEGKRYSEKSLWKSLREQAKNSTRDESTWVTAAQCENNLEKLHKKIDSAQNPQNPSGFVVRLVKNIFNFFFSHHIDVKHKENKLEQTLLKTVKSDPKISQEARRTIEFVKIFDKNFPELRKLVQQASYPLKEGLLDNIATEIANASLHKIPQLENGVVTCIASTNFEEKKIALFEKAKQRNVSIDSTYIKDDLKELKDEIGTLSDEFLSQLSSKVHEKLKPSFIDKLASYFEGEDKATCEALFRYAASVEKTPEQPVASEKLKKLLSDPKTAKRIHTLLDTLQKHEAFFKNIVNVQNFVKTIKELLKEHYSIPQLDIEQLKSLFQKPEEKTLLEHLLSSDPKILNDEMTKSLSKKALWESELAIVKRLGEEKENLSATVAAIAILKKITPPQENRVAYSTVILSLGPVSGFDVEKTEFSQKVVENARDYQGIDKDLLKKALIVSLTEDPQLESPEYKPTSATPFLLGLANANPPFEETANICLSYIPKK